MPLLQEYDLMQETHEEFCDISRHYVSEGETDVCPNGCILLACVFCMKKHLATCPNKVD